MLIEQVNQALRFMAFFTASGLGKTGMVSAETITIDVYGPSGSLVSNGVVTEVGGGWYSYNLASGSVTAPGEYVAVFESTDVTCDVRHISDRATVGRTWVTNLDTNVASRGTLTAAGVWNYATRNLTDFGLALSAPVTTPTVSVTGGGSTGGSLQAGAYYLKYTHSNAAGETTASPVSAQFTVSSGNIPRVTLPSLPSGAVYTNIYLTQAAGATGTETLYKTGVTTTTTDLTTATTSGQPLVPVVNTTNSLITAIWTATTRTLSAFGFNVTVGSNTDKTGYKLAADGLDQIAVTDPGAISSHTTIPKMLVALWRWTYKKTDATSSVARTYKDDNSTVNVSMALSNDGTTQVKSAGV